MERDQQLGYANDDLYTHPGDALQAAYNIMAALDEDPDEFIPHTGT